LKVLDAEANEWYLYWSLVSRVELLM
jgi:hypothetical protein